MGDKKSQTNKDDQKMITEYGEGYQARNRHEPFDPSKSKDWQRGWFDSNAWYQMVD